MPNAVSAVKPISELSLKELTVEYNRLSGLKPIKLFKDRTTGIRRINALLDKSIDQKLTEMKLPKVNSEGLKLAAKEGQERVSSVAKIKGPKKLTWRDTKIKVLKPNPRREGTKAFELYRDMVDFLKLKPEATARELFTHTKYRPQDYRWDLKHGNIQVKE